MDKSFSLLRFITTSCQIYHLSIRFLPTRFEIFGFGLKSQFRIFQIYRKIRFLLRKDTNCKIRVVVLSKTPAIVRWSYLIFFGSVFLLVSIWFLS